jgi:hypothetical protein
VNQNHQCSCVFPSSTEQEFVTIPGQEPGTAIRMFAETGPDGYVRLQQLAFCEGTGWYVQKSFIVPGEALAMLLPQLRKAQCLIPEASQQRPQQPLRFPRLSRAERPDPLAERRGA